MPRKKIFIAESRRRDPVPRLLSAAALVVSIIALIGSLGGLAPAAGTHPTSAQAAKHRKEQQRRSRQRKKTDRQKAAALEKRLGKLTAACPVSGSIDLGSWCLEGSTFKVPTAEAGQNDYVYAAQKCVAEGGWLPTAAQLIGAAPLAALKSTTDDDPGTSGASEFPQASVGIKDEREMTSDLFTVGPGARAAGSEGSTAGSRGVGNLGEPDPVPTPAEPLPETLDYVTVFDNHDLGGFAGGEPVGKAENFRCAYAKGYQGRPKNVSSRS
jgi:hypothetical protein